MKKDLDLARRIRGERLNHEPSSSIVLAEEGPLFSLPYRDAK